MEKPAIALRLLRLPVVTCLGRDVRVADRLGARLLGLARLDREQAGGGLLLPRCSSVHTFGMRFSLDLYFLDESGAAVAVLRNVPRRRVVACHGASAVLEIPAAEGGEVFSPAP